MWFTELKMNENKQTDSGSAVDGGGAGDPPTAIRDQISGAWMHACLHAWKKSGRSWAVSNFDWALHWWWAPAATAETAGAGVPPAACCQVLCKAVVRLVQPQREPFISLVIYAAVRQPNQRVTCRSANCPMFCELLQTPSFPKTATARIKYDLLRGTATVLNPKQKRSPLK